MAEAKKVVLVDPAGSALAELLVTDEEEGWFTGKVLSHRFAGEVEKALAWYDEVVRDQMLSFLDEATAIVERFELRARFPDGSAPKVYSLHVDRANEVSFRTSPVPPPVWSPRVTVQ